MHLGSWLFGQVSSESGISKKVSWKWFFHPENDGWESSKTKMAFSLEEIRMCTSSEIITQFSWSKSGDY